MDNRRWIETLGETKKVYYPYKVGVIEVYANKSVSMGQEDIRALYKAAKGGGKRARTIVLPQGQRIVFSIIRPTKKEEGEQLTLLGEQSWQNTKSTF